MYINILYVYWESLREREVGREREMIYVIYVIYVKYYMRILSIQFS